MDGIRRSGEIIMMAGVAGRRRAAVPLAVAFQTAQAGVSAGQREAGLIVIKADFTPTARDMTHFAGGRIAFRHVIGIGGSFEILIMAGVAER